MLLRFLKFFHELTHLRHFFHQISHLSGISTAWLLSSGLLCGVNRLIRPVLLAAVLDEPTALVGVVGRERPIHSLAPFAILGDTALLMGVPFIGPSPVRILPGYLLIRQFGGCSNLVLVGSGCFVGLLSEQFLDVLEVQ